MCELYTCLRSLLVLILDPQKFVLVLKYVAETVLGEVIVVHTYIYAQERMNYIIKYCTP